MKLETSFNDRNELAEIRVGPSSAGAFERTEADGATILAWRGMPLGDEHGALDAEVRSSERPEAPHEPRRVADCRCGHS